MSWPLILAGVLLATALLSPPNLKAEWVAVCDQELFDVTKRIAQDAVSVHLLDDQIARRARNSKTEINRNSSETDRANCSVILFDPAHDFPANAMWRQRLAWHGISIQTLEPGGKLEKRTRAIQVHGALAVSFPQHAALFRHNLHQEFSRANARGRPLQPWADRNAESPAATIADRPNLLR